MRQGKGWTKWQPAESRIVWDNQHMQYGEIAQLLQAAGYLRDAEMVRSHLKTLKKRQTQRPRAQQHTRPSGIDDRARYAVLEALILEARARIESGVLRLEKPGSPAVQAVDIVLRGCNANPGILDELVVMMREESA